MGPITENIKVSSKGGRGYYGLKKHKLWFHEECSELFDQKKQTKLQWLQDQNEINRNELNKVICEASRHYRNNKKEYMKGKINDLATHSKNKNIGDLYKGINSFKKGYQLRTNVVNDENSNLLADSHTILNRWKNYFN
jgi:hypothetical protein